MTASLRFGQLRDMPPDVLQLPWSFWPYRTAGTGFPSALYELYVHSVEGHMYVLSSLQVTKTTGEYHNSVPLGLVV